MFWGFCKNKTFIFIYFLCCAVFAESQSQINKFELHTCNENVKKCVLVSAESAESGSLNPSMMLKQVLIVVKNRQGKVLNLFKEKKGFYDIQNNRIILAKLTHQNSLKETIIELKDLEIFHTEMK